MVNLTLNQTRTRKIMYFKDEQHRIWKWLSVHEDTTVSLGRVLSWRDTLITCAFQLPWWSLNPQHWHWRADFKMAWSLPVDLMNFSGTCPTPIEGHNFLDKIYIIHIATLKTVLWKDHWMKAKRRTENRLLGNLTRYLTYYQFCSTTYEAVGLISQLHYSIRVLSRLQQKNILKSCSFSPKFQPLSNPVIRSFLI